jgi:hypothetical protein
MWSWCGKKVYCLLRIMQLCYRCCDCRRKAACGWREEKLVLHLELAFTIALLLHELVYLS